MNALLKSSTCPDKETLRIHIIGALDGIELIERIVDPVLPWQGEPILAMDSQHRPLILSFDTHDTGRALVNGLRAMEQAWLHHPLLSRVHPELFDHQAWGHLQLLLILPEPLPSIPLFANNREILLYTFQCLTVDGDLAILIEPQEKTESVFLARPPIVSEAPKTPPTLQKTELDTEEKRFFQSL